MSALKRWWIKLAGFAEVLDGVDDPTGNYILSLGRRIEKLEHQVEDLAGQMRSRAGGGSAQ